MNRQKLIVRTGIIGIITNVVLVVFKMLVGVMAGSIAIVLDAVNNLTDVLSSVVTIVGAKLATKRPDQDHPFGHGRSEYIAALMVGVIILLTGVMSLVESVPKIIHPELADYSWATLTVVVAAILAKIALGLYTRKQGHRLNSSSLLASGVDALFDVLLSTATLVGIIVTMAFGISIDGILGAIISLFIVRTSIMIIIDAMNDIMGKVADHKLVQKIKRQIGNFPEVGGVYDLMLHNYGPTDIMGSVQIQIPDSLTAKQIHHLTHDISQKIFSKYGVMLTIGIYSDNSDQAEHREIKEYLQTLISTNPEIHQMHALYVDDEDGVVSFDLVMAYDYANKIQLKNKIIRAMKQKFPKFSYSVTIDVDLEG